MISIQRFKGKGKEKLEREKKRISGDGIISKINQK